MNRVHQQRRLVVLGLNAGMGTAAGADELVEIPYRRNRLTRTKAHPLHLSTSTSLVSHSPTNSEFRNLALDEDARAGIERNRLLDLHEAAFHVGLVSLHRGRVRQERKLRQPLED